MTQKEQVFVISPIGDEGSATRKRADEVFEYIIRPAVESFGLSAMRADKDPTPGQVTSRLLRSILESRAIIADLTGRNPNVYYELGVVHSFARPLVILVDKAESLTFDTQNEGVIEIRDDGKIGVGEAAQARIALAGALKVILQADYQAMSIVTEVAAAQSLSALAPENPVASELSSLSEKMDELLYRLPSGGVDTSTGPSTPMTRLLMQPIEDLDLTVRAYNVLKREGVRVIADILAFSEEDLAGLRNLGQRGTDEIRTKLEEVGLSLRRASNVDDEYPDL